MSDGNGDASRSDATPESSTADSNGPRRIAIACQGGGSHTAFTAGVLRELLANWTAGEERFELVGISGTSGGAVNALGVWYGLLTGGPSTAVEILDGIWSDLAASDAFDRLLNDWVRTYTRLDSMGVGLPSVSPYRVPYDDAAQRRLAEILERYVDFDAIPELSGAERPELVIGAVNLERGDFETFTDEDVTVDAVLASAALPTVFEAVEVDGQRYWDGLFSQNPPVHDLMSVPGERTPDELWVVQINPQRRSETPTTLTEIADRRNELGGNISLNQELRFIERINEWIEAGHFDHPDYTVTTIHRIELTGYHHATKLDRDPDFLEELMARGERRAAAFLADRT